MAKMFLETFKQLISVAINFIIGAVFLNFLFIFILISIPIYIYRWIICNVVAPSHRPKIGQPVDPFGSTYAAEFISKDFYNRSSRCTMVTSTIIQGTLSFETIMDDINRKWINAENEVGKDGKKSLRYPEFQQYIESWMGFMFWKQEDDFDLRKHMKHHVISKDHSNHEEYITNLIENLVNKPFLPKLSPWEIHVIHGYRNDNLFPSLNNGNYQSQGYQHHHDTEEVDHPNEKEMTVFVLRVHHALADGFAVMSAEIEGLLGLSLDEHLINKRSTQKLKKNISIHKTIIKFLKLLLKMVYDVGYTIGLELQSQMNSPWHIPDDKKRWKQLFGRTPLIPVEKISFIKKTFGVSFTAVMFSAMSAALSDNLKRKQRVKFGDEVNLLPVSTALPLTRTEESRYKLRNRLTGTSLNIPISHCLNPKERLEQAEQQFQLAKNTTVPIFVHFFVNTMATHLAIVANLLFRNRILAAGLSNFPGPSFTAYWKGKKLLNTDVTVAGLPGLAGICFMSLSYDGYIRICFTAEKAVIEKQEMIALVNCAVDEIDCLYKLAREEFKPSIHPADD